jgi:replicative DNA helicase
MHDIDLVKKLMDKALYTRIIPYIKQYAVGSITWDVIQGLGKYYKSYPSADVAEFDEFKKFFYIIHSKSIKAEKHALYTTYFERLEKCDVDSEMLVDVLKNYITKDYANKIFHLAMSIEKDTDEACIDDIAAVVTQYNREIGRTVTREDLFISTDISCVTKAVTGTGFEWRLEELNMSLGPIRHGDFVIIAARPETGKTTMVASEVANFIPQLTDDRPIMWVNNEEAGSKVMFRVVQSYFGKVSSDITANTSFYKEEFDKVCKGRFLLINDDGGMNDVLKLNTLFEEYNPCLIVFDQLDKVQGFHKAEREDLRIGSLYEWGRALAKKYGPVIAVSQVDGSGEGAEWINMNQLRGSKTDKIGEADAIITIGKSLDKSKEFNRYINVPKNKLFGGPRSMEVHRHGMFEVTIVPELARYEGVH